LILRVSAASQKRVAGSSAAKLRRLLAAAVRVWFFVLSGYNGALSGIQNAARQRVIVALHVGMDALLKNQSSHDQPVTTVADGIQCFVAWPRDYYKVKS
jgi:hypothetical protein